MIILVLWFVIVFLAILRIDTKNFVEDNTKMEYYESVLEMLKNIKEKKEDATKEEIKHFLKVWEVMHSKIKSEFEDKIKNE